jgi:hypothetical protein
MEPTPRQLWQKWMWTETGAGLPAGKTAEEIAQGGAARQAPKPRL